MTFASTIQQRKDESLQQGRGTPMTGQNLAATIGRGTFFGIIAGLTQMTTRLVTVPIVIGHLGLDGYGIWSIIMVVAAYMRFGSAGVKSAFQKYVAEATGSGNFVRANQLLSTGTATMLVLSIVGLIPIAFLSSGLARIMGVPDQFLDSTGMAISLLAVVMVLSNVGASYEAVLMGANRIDLTRKFNTAFTILEAIAIVVFLYKGYGLVALTTIMALSELGYLLCCYLISRRILPLVEIATKYLTRDVWWELFSFAGSYQLVGILEVLYAAILPIVIMRFYGPNTAGIYAVSNRLVAVALVAQAAFFHPVLSGGSMVYALGSAETMRRFIIKSFRTTFALALLPLAFMASYGSLIVFAWTGLVDSEIRMVLGLTCLAAFFSSLSLLALVLYRASGRIWMDNIRQVLRLVVLLLIAMFGDRLGLFGILGGLVLAELIGMIFMFTALTTVFEGFTVRMLVPDAARLTTAMAALIFVGIIVSNVPVPWELNERLLATLKLGALALTTLLAALPILLVTGSVSRSEMGAIMRMHRIRQ